MVWYGNKTCNLRLMRVEQTTISPTQLNSRATTGLAYNEICFFQ